MERREGERCLKDEWDLSEYRKGQEMRKRKSA